MLSAFAVSISVCSGYGMITCVIAAAFAAVIYVIKPDASLLPLFLGYCINLTAIRYTGLGAAMISMMLAGAFILLSGKVSSLKKGIFGPVFLPTVMLSLALVITVINTNEYFGIEASGKNVVEMLTNYHSLGFHPNWRGILYGTIVMVVMITFPRKFKKGSKIISPYFWAVIITYLLNFALVPKGTVETFEMIKEPEFVIYSIKNMTDIDNNGISTLLYILLFAFSLAVCYILALGEEEKNNKDYLYTGAAGILTPALFGYALPGKVSRKSEDMLMGIVSAVIIFAFAFLTKCFTRLPVSSCAVVMIVGAWQQIKWGKMKDAFSGAVNIITFFAIIILSLLVNIAAGVLAGAFICSVCEKIREMKKEEN